MRFVIDTNILIKACQHYSPDSVTLIWLFYHNATFSIALDVGKNVIMQEYRQNLKDNEMFRKWMVAMTEANKISYVSGSLEKKIRKKLTKLGFHEASDQTFVAVALHSDKNIITEDSDYGKGKEDKAGDAAKQGVLAYMTHDLKLNIMDAKEGREFMKIF